MTTFWEIAAHSVSHLFSLYLVLFVILVISHLGFEGGICHLIALVPVHCFLITFTNDTIGTNGITNSTISKNLNDIGILLVTLGRTMNARNVNI